MKADGDKIREAADAINDGFDWGKTREGGEYWYAIHRRLMELAEDADREVDLTEGNSTLCFTREGIDRIREWVAAHGKPHLVGDDKTISVCLDGWLSKVRFCYITCTAHLEMRASLAIDDVPHTLLLSGDDVKLVANG